jgi:2-polyprenyl-6-methoxyphenol hydroxylase-like FAD-dependent oxidoreductase
MSTLPQETDVAIVGAGPVGLALGVALAQYGVDAVVVDAAEERSRHSKAAVVHSRTLEVLREFGVADELVGRGVVVPYFAFRDRDRTLLTTDFSALPTPYPYTLMLPQDVTEAVLDKRLHDAGRTVERPWRVTDLQQDDASVLLDLADGHGATRQLRARYVVGADGAHSSVRHLLGVGFTGSAYAESFFLADVRMDWGLSREEVQLFFSQTGLVVVAPLPGGAHRIVATVDGPIEAAGIADVQALLTERGPRRPPAVVRDLIWSSNFRVSHRVADRYRDGRVFLAGDAGHVHSPAGGQGMNTGIQDAVNLAWKLAMVCGGRADAALLDTYEAERRPVAQEVVRAAHRLTTLATMHGRARRTVRNAALGLAGLLPAVPRTMAENLSELAISYATGSGRRGTRAGDRATADLPAPPPGAPVYRLVVPEHLPHERLTALRQAAEQQSADVVVLRAGRDATAQLVRPDGYLAAAGPADEAHDLLSALPVRLSQ